MWYICTANVPNRGKSGSKDVNVTFKKKKSKCSKYNFLQECDDLSEEFGNLLDINEGSSSSVINNATSFECKLEVQGKKYNYNDIREVL